MCVRGGGMEKIFENVRLKNHFARKLKLDQNLITWV